jgi:hypothetical protein
MALDMDLDLMGAQPVLFKLYTQLAFVFPLPDTHQQAQIISTITRGLERLSKSFPWVADQVVNITTDFDQPPCYRIRPLEPVPRLFIKDYNADATVPTFAQLATAGFPTSMMGEDSWVPCPTLSAGFEPLKALDDNVGHAPVLLKQLSFIQGGLVLCINM